MLLIRVSTTVECTRPRAEHRPTRLRLQNPNSLIESDAAAPEDGRTPLSSE